MPRALKDFSPADPGEVSIYTFDFAPALSQNPNGAREKILIVDWYLSVASSSTQDDSNDDTLTSDLDPMSHLQGLPTINGTLVSQLVGNLVAGVTYEIGATIQTDQLQKWTCYANVHCQEMRS